MPRRFISALGMIKGAALEVNVSLGVLEGRLEELIREASLEVEEGSLDSEFVVDVYQTGSGTSTNMNVNEVIAGRANELSGGPRGGKVPVHPNDHVNLQQSSNDVIPTAMHLSTALAIRELLVPALSGLEMRLQAKANQFDEVVKIGRTHLQDATPVRAGQVIGGWAQQVRNGVERCLRATVALCELPLGGTAVGTGINSHPEFAGRVIALLAERTGLPLREAGNHFEAQGAKDAVVEASGLLRGVAVGLQKVANDVRWLASGPRCGIGELIIPATQPGSSIMPGKVNPVMSEMLMMACARVVGMDATVAWCASHGSNFELNVMMPLMAYELLDAVETLGNAVRVFSERCVAGLEVDGERCRGMVEESLAMCTALAPVIGYDAAAEIAKESAKTGKTVREVARERLVGQGRMTEEGLEQALDALRMTSPQSDMIGGGG
jgi:fumarate hydratase class II